MPALTLYWYVIYTYPNQERKIHSLLTHQDLIAYLPMHQVMRQWSDRVKAVMMPMFPNYLFVHIPDTDRARVLQVPGVARFIAFEGHPAIIAADEIEMIRRLENTTVALESHLLTGDRVQITQGPFAGLEGVLFRRLGKAQFGIRLDGLRQALSLEICETYLKKL